MESAVVKGCGFCVALHAFDDIRLLPLSSKKLMPLGVRGLPRRKKNIYIYKRKKKGGGREVGRSRESGGEKEGRKRALSSLRVKSRSNYEHLATSNLLLGGLNAPPPIHARIYIFLWSPVCGAGERNAQKVVVQIPSR